MGENTLDIASKLRPHQSLLEQFAATRPGLVIDGILGQQPSISIRRHGEKEERSFEIWGPEQAIEDEDLDPELADIVPAPCWLLSIVLESEPRRQDWADANSLAQFVAETCSGAVLYRELGDVVWPKKPRKRTRLTLEAAPRVDLVKVDWFVHMSQRSVATAAPLLATLKRICPEALPTRFGFNEPMEGRVTNEEYSNFSDAWCRGKEEERLPMLSFKAKPPCFYGHVSFPLRILGPVTSLRNLVRVGLGFDSRILLRDSRWCEEVVTLFVELSKDLNAFYSRAYVERGWILYRGLSGGMPDTEQYPIPLGHEWYGLPPAPMWLSWFGRPYKDLIGRSLQNLSQTTLDNGVFVRSGVMPLNWDQLKGISWDLPRHLQAKVKEDVFWKKISKRDHGHYIAEPAEFIPDIAA